MATNPENETLFSCFHYRGCCTVLYEDTLLPGTFCNRKGHVRKAWRRSKFITNFQHIFFWNPRNFQFISGQCISKSGSTGVADCYYDACKARPTCTQSSAVDRLRLQVALHRPRLQHSVWRGQARLALGHPDLPFFLLFFFVQLSCCLVRFICISVTF